MTNDAGGGDPGDVFDLERFVVAQQGTYEAACRELRAGRKSGHWIWFIFPQMRGLGRSGMAWDFGIASLEEAKAYLAHPLLGPRLEEVTRLVLAHDGTPIRHIFGTPDDLKFRSSMTLFAAAGGDGTDIRSLYQDAIDRMCDCSADQLTLDLLATEGADGA